MARGRNPAWSEDELNLLRQWISENPTMPAQQVGRALEGTINRTEKAITLRASDMKKAQGTPPRPVEVKREMASEKLMRMAGELEGRAQVLREMAKEIAAIESWARDTLTIKRQLFGYDVDTASGLVENVRRK